jgi:succinate dehydrogenase / fumarate reductase, cytochrome b subunit
MTQGSRAQGSRPLSPHVQIYGVYLTMAFSFMHRISGFAIASGLLLFTWWVTALARGPESFAVVQGVMQSFLGTLVLIGFTLAFFYHACSGIRHFVFDAGYGLDKVSIRQSAIFIGAAAVFLTVVFWLVILVAA